MLIKAEQKYLRASPIKLRFVVNTVRGVKSPIQAIAYLEHVQKRASLPIIKVLKQAVANAKHNYGLDEKSLVIHEMMINEGPRLKRFTPVSRGMAHPILKKTAHIRVVLEDRKVQEQVQVEENKGEQVKSQKAKVKSASKKLKA